MTFDLASLETSTKSEAGVDMEVIHPRTASPVMNDDGAIVTIRLMGRNSAAYLEEERRVRERRNERAGRGYKITMEDLTADEINLLCVVTTAWNFGLVDGQPFPCNRENIRKLWSDARFRWLRERAITFVLADGNFLAS